MGPRAQGRALWLSDHTCGLCQGGWAPLGGGHHGRESLGPPHTQDPCCSPEKPISSGPLSSARFSPPLNGPVGGWGSSLSVQAPGKVGSRMARCTHRERLAGTAPSGAGEGSGAARGAAPPPMRRARPSKGGSSCWSPVPAGPQTWDSRKIPSLTVDAQSRGPALRGLARGLGRSLAKCWQRRLRVSCLRKLGASRGVAQCLRPPPATSPGALSLRVRRTRPRGTDRCPGADKTRGQGTHRDLAHIIAPTWNHLFQSPNSPSLL